MGIECPEKEPEWLESLIRAVSDLIRPLGFIGQIGFRYLPPGSPQNTTGCWVVGLYQVPYELSGGESDGASAVSGFCLNTLKLLALFSEITTLEWKVPRGYTDGLTGPEVWLEGIYQDLRVQLHVYEFPPADELPSLVLDVTTNTLRAK